MPWEQRQDLEGLIDELKVAGVRIVALEQDKQSQEIGKWQLHIGDTTGVALIVGNEVNGVASEILKVCDDIVHIPMHGKKESLNVSVAAGVAMWELSKRIYT